MNLFRRAKNDDPELTALQQLAPWHQAIPLPSGHVTSDGNDVDSERTISVIDPWRLSATFASLFNGNGLEGKSFLDVGCNAGGYCFAAKEMGASRVLGFDARSHWIDQAEHVRSTRGLTSNDIEFNVMHLEELADANEQFDVTLFKGVFYHLPNPIRAIEILASVTRHVMLIDTATSSTTPDNSLILKFESPDHLMSGVDGLSWYPGGPEVISNLAKNYGFPASRLLYNRTSDRADPRDVASPLVGRCGLLVARNPATIQQPQSAPTPTAKTVANPAPPTTRPASDTTTATAPPKRETDPQNQPFIILGHQRSGSQLLQDLLSASPQLRVEGEWLGGHFRTKGEAFEPILNLIFGRPTHTHRHSGCRIFHDHLTESEHQAMAERPGMRVIHLERRNLLRAMVSSAVAQHTGQWSIFPHDVAASLDERRVTLDIAKTVRKLEYLSSALDTTRAFYAETPSIQVYYEDLVSDRGRELQRIGELLGVELRPGHETSLEKQNPETMRELVSNIGELETALVGTPWELMLAPTDPRGRPW